jgi:hypothetical protein
VEVDRTVETRGSSSNKVSNDEIMMIIRKNREDEVRYVKEHILSDS